MIKREVACRHCNTHSYEVAIIKIVPVANDGYFWRCIGVLDANLLAICEKRDHSALHCSDIGCSTEPSYTKSKRQKHSY